ncbi:MAG: ArsR/SmtB family transcription factor [Acidimicrobiales bacterium]
MAPATTTTDAFTAIADTRRRDILLALAGGEAAVGEIVDRLRLSQPQVSKHLSVLRTVGLVRCRTDGRRRLYRVHGPALHPVRDWMQTFAAHCNERLGDLLVELQQEENQ